MEAVGQFKFCGIFSRNSGLRGSSGDASDSGSERTDTGVPEDGLGLAEWKPLSLTAVSGLSAGAVRASLPTIESIEKASFGLDDVADALLLLDRLLFSPKSGRDISRWLAISPNATPKLCKWLNGAA